MTKYYHNTKCVYTSYGNSTKGYFCLSKLSKEDYLFCAFNNLTYVSYMVIKVNHRTGANLSIT